MTNELLGESFAPFKTVVMSPLSLATDWLLGQTARPGRRFISDVLTISGPWTRLAIPTL